MPVSLAMPPEDAVSTLRSASFTAAIIRSWSISTSSGSTASGSMVRLVSSCLPLTTALTTPPPEVDVYKRQGRVTLDLRGR